MNRVFRVQPEPIFHDFLPWADPYITSLVEKVRRAQGRLLETSDDNCPDSGESDE